MVLIILYKFYLFSISSFNPSLPNIIFFNLVFILWIYNFLPCSFCKSFIGFQFHHLIQNWWYYVFFLIWSSLFWFSFFFRLFYKSIVFIIFFSILPFNQNIVFIFYLNFDPHYFDFFVLLLNWFFFWISPFNQIQNLFYILILILILLIASFLIYFV